MLVNSFNAKGAGSDAICCEDSFPFGSQVSLKLLSRRAVQNFMADHRLELYIETLTGTAFELQVSPLETIMSIKAKIQHLEGIPISQQHLIWNAEELDNGCCLEDYHIADGATLKLVLGMRGGPLNTRMYTVDRRPSLSTMAEYLESAAGEELLEGSRPLTVVVFHDGEQVHWYTLIDEGEYSSSTTHSRSESSASSMPEGRETVELSNEQLSENHKMKLKMSALQKRFRNLSLKRKSKRKLTPTKDVTNRSSPFLPPLHVQGSAILTEKHHHTRGVRNANRRESVDKLPSISSANVLETPTRHNVPRMLPPPPRLPLHPPPSSCHSRSSCSSPPSGEAFPTPTVFSPSYDGRRVLPDIHRSNDVSGTPSRIMAASRLQNCCRYSSQAATPSGQVLPLELEAWLRNRPKTTPDKWDGLYTPFEGIVLSHHRDPSLGRSVHNVGGSNSYGRTSRLGGGTTFRKAPLSAKSLGLGALVAAGLRGLRSSRKKKETETENAAAHQGEGRPGSTLPPVQIKKKGKRCNWCNKKTGLASTYICRCGRSFCATHRYPETHRCNHDFKTEGRKILEKSNPLIAAPKLPKI